MASSPVTTANLSPPYCPSESLRIKCSSSAADLLLCVNIGLSSSGSSAYTIGCAPGSLRMRRTAPLVDAAFLE
jgi:hypothetical protein